MNKTATEQLVPNLMDTP